MFEAIAISAAGVWLALYVFILIGTLFWASEIDSFIIGTSVLIVGFAVGQFALKLPLYAMLAANPLLAIAYIVIHIAVGALYTSMWRLPVYIRKNGSIIQTQYNEWKDRITRDADRVYREENRGNYQANKSEKPVIDTSFDTFLNSSSYRFAVRNNKDRVASWVLLWPVDLVWEMIHKPFIWLWDMVYYGLGDVLERINKNIARKILEEKNK